MEHGEYSQRYFLIFILVSQWINTNAVDLAVNINLIDLNGLVNPTRLNYYWLDQSDTTQRNLNLKISLFTSKNTNVVLTQPASITIKCSQLPSSDAEYAFVTFNDQTVTLSQTSNQIVSFTIKNNGKSPLIFCSASANNFPTQTIGGEVLNKMVVYDSNKIFLNVLSYPTISFEPGMSSTTAIQISPFSSSYIFLYFRDKIVYNSVTLKCSVTGAQSLSLGTNSEFKVMTDSSTTRVIYSLDSSKLSLSDQFIVKCTAQTDIGPGSSLLQYQAASASATLSFIQPKLSFGIAEQTKLVGSDFKIPVILNTLKAQGTRTQVECSVTAFNSASEYETFKTSVKDTSCPRDFQKTTSTFGSSATFNGIGFDWFLADANNASIYYSLRQFTIEGAKFNVDARITRVRNNPLKFPTLSYISLFCCDSTNPTLASYSNAISLFTVGLPSNLDPIVVSGSLKEPTNVELLDPSFSACNCDLLIGVCDFNCCCDSKCTSEDKKVFPAGCPEQQRGILVKEFDRWYCDDAQREPRLEEDSYFPIVCVQFNTSVLLGKYYSPDTLDQLVQSDSFANLVKSKVELTNNFKSEFVDTKTLSKTSKYCDLSLAGKNGYSSGDCLWSSRNTLFSDPVDFMRFPQSLHSSCVYDSTIRFLYNAKSACTITLDSSLSVCQSNSILDYSRFQLDGLVLKNPGLGAKVEVESEYWKCKIDSVTTQNSQTLVCSVVGGNTCQFSNNMKLFDYDDVSDQCVQDTWSFSESRLKTIPLDYSTSYFTQTNSQCTKIPSAQATRPKQNGATCSNSLTNVEHVIFWSGGEITKILTRFVLSDFTFAQTKPFLKQNFKIKWSQQTNSTYPLANDQLLSVTDFDQFISSDTFIQTLESSLNGYRPGMPLISGTGQNTNQVKVTFDRLFSTFNSLDNKLCGKLSKLERSPLKFNQNASTSCVVRVSNSDLSGRTCNCLRRLVFNKINDYFAPSSFVSKNGKFAQASWISVFPTVRQMKSLDDSMLNISGSCPDVPYKLNAIFFYSNVGKSSGQPIYEIIGAYLNYSYAKWSFNCKSGEDCLTKDFTIEFQANFLSVDEKKKSWPQKCESNPTHSEACIQQVFFTWPTDYNDPDFFYLYTVHLGLIFGAFAFFIVYAMIFGPTCPC